MPVIGSLCERCRHVREIISGKGSRFLMCEHSRTDPRYPKYPPQPVLRCEAFEESGNEQPKEEGR